MKKENVNTAKKAVAMAAEKSLTKIADIFAALPCTGPWYEPKMPEKLKK